MLTLGQYDIFIDNVAKFDKYIQEHPEEIEEAACKFAEQLADVKDVVLGDKVPLTKGINSVEDFEKERINLNEVYCQGRFLSKWEDYSVGNN